MFELLVVIVILGLLATVSIPWINKIRRRAQIRSAAMEISTTLVAARMKAVRRNLNVSVFITPAASVGEFSRITTIEATPVATPAVVPTPGANSLADLLISGSTLRFVDTPTGGITFDGGGRRIVPLSTTPVGTIKIEGPLGGGPVNPITIETNTAGRVRIITPVAWQ
jgi:Tfp pilus assembly protein FimT